MTPEQYTALCNLESAPKTISAKAHKDGTLLFGYDCERNTWHVYKANNKINILIYSQNDIISFCSQSEFNVEEVFPNKRVYSERSDYDFILEIFQKSEIKPSLMKPLENLTEKQKRLPRFEDFEG